jgi:coproporphyrinogen III oxidase
MAAITLDDVERSMREVQDHIANWLESVSGGQKYHEDIWEYNKGSGGGRSRIWEGSANAVLEKAGVNFSRIDGSQLPKYVS